MTMQSGATDDEPAVGAGEEPGLGTAPAEPWALRNTKGIVLWGSLATVVVGVLAVAAGRYGWFATTETTTIVAADGDVTTTSTTDPGAVRDALLRLATAVGAVTAGLLAWGRLELSRQEHGLARAADARAADSQITDRYTRAVEQLGHADFAVRLGALYALERIAHDSPGDRRTIYMVVCAYVRHHSTRHAEHQQQVLDDDGHAVKVDDQAVDYRAAVAIALRAPADLRLRRDLAGAVLNQHVFDARTNLTDVDLAGATLTNVEFNGATLTDVDFAGATLTNVEFNGATLTDVDFADATLSGTHFGDGATLTGVRFVGRASLTEVYFGRIALTDVRFAGRATLTGVYFARTALTDVHFDDATLTDVHFDDATLSGVSGVHFHDATLTDVQFNAGTTLTNVVFDAATLTNVDFADATLTNVDFADATLIGVEVPDGVNPGKWFGRHTDGRWYSDIPAFDASADDGAGVDM